MFTVSGRVINELVELTCAINFSLLFSFRELGREKAKQPKLFHGGWREGREGREDGTLQQQHRLQFASKSLSRLKVILTNVLKSIQPPHPPPILPFPALER